MASLGVVLFALVLGHLPALAQALPSTVVIYGRVEDAASGQPIGRARVIAADSTLAVSADSLGNFAIPLRRDDPYILWVEQFGYEPTSFELTASAPSQLSILRVEPAPIELEGISVVEEGAIAQFLDRLDNRRNGYSGTVTVYDHERIESRVVGGSAYDLVRQAMPQARPCGDFLLDLCRRARGVMGQVLVCIDDWRSFDPIMELEGIPIESVAMAEFYGPGIGFGLTAGPSALLRDSPFSASPGPLHGQVRIYTPQWIVSRASRNSRYLWPASMGC